MFVALGGFSTDQDHGLIVFVPIVVDRRQHINVSSIIVLVCCIPIEMNVDNWYYFIT